LSPGKHKQLSGDLSAITQVELVNQNPLGKSSRSNPVTYVNFVEGKVDSLTADYLTGKKEIAVPKTRRKGVNKVNIK